MMEQAKLIYFDIKTSLNSGKLSVAHLHKEFPFDIKRIFWIYDVEKDEIRGNHAHYESQQIIICMHGKVEIEIQSLDGKSTLFILENPDKGLFIPPLCWHSMKFDVNTVLQVLSSTHYNEEDYIRNFIDFQKILQQQ